MNDNHFRSDLPPGARATSDDSVMESTIATEAGPGVTQVRSLDASVQGFDHTYASEEPHSEESQSLKENITPTKNSINRWHLSKALWNVWWLEVSSSLLGLGCLLAIVIILSVHDERPLPNWPDLISINSLIAIFTAVFKAALILPIAEGMSYPTCWATSRLRSS